MTQPSANLSALRPLLFDYEPEKLATLTHTTASAIKEARAVAEVDILFRLAFLDTAVPFSAPPQPSQPPQPIGPLLTGAAPGDVVRLAAGSYVGTASVMANISIVADGDVVWWASDDGSCLQIGAEATATISGVRFQQASPTSTMPVLQVQGSLHASGVQLRVLGGEGVSVTGAAVLEQVLIDGGQRGVVVRGGAVELLQVRCTGQRDTGIALQTGSNAVLRDVTVQGAGTGVRVQGAQAETAQLTITGCAEDGVQVGAGGRLSGTGGVVQRCQGQAVRVQRKGIVQLSGWEVEENLGAGLLIRDGGRAALHAVTMRRQDVGVVVDVGASLSHRACNLGELIALEGATVRERSAVLLPIVVVDPAGGGDRKTIQEAIEAVDDGGVIQLQPGRYVETIELDIDARIVGVGAVGDVIWSARRSMLVAKGCEVTCQNITFKPDNKQRQDMVWLRGSEGIFTDCIFEGAGLSAIVADERSQLRVEDCRFLRPHQGGVVVRERSRATIERCFFSKSRMAAIHVRLNSVAIVRECRINNPGQGGVLVYEDARLEMERCELRACGLAGVEVRDEADATLRECRLLEGAQAAIFVHKGARAVAERCDLIGTTRRARPGVEVTDRGKLTLHSCRIRGSDAALRCRDRGHLVVKACDLAGNKRLQDKNRTGRIEMASCRRGKDTQHLRVLLIELDTTGAIWPVPDDAQELDLRGAFLPGADLKGFNLDGADLTGAFMPATLLDGASAQLTTFKRAFLAAASFKRAKLHGASFDSSYLRRASMVGADTTQVSLFGADTKGMAT